jgi:hypothetical protein
MYLFDGGKVDHVNIQEYLLHYRYNKYIMSEKFIKVAFDHYCDWQGDPPAYRIYVNDELFVERLYRWNNDYCIEEMLQISAPPGDYLIQLVPLADFGVLHTTANLRVEYGPAHVENDNLIRIW